MSEWKQDRVRARLARQGAEDRGAAPAKKKQVEREWLIVGLYGWFACWHSDEERKPATISSHRTEDDARREFERRTWRSGGRSYYIVRRDVWHRIYRPLWS